jgi:hypothetical protein
MSEKRLIEEPRETNRFVPSLVQACEPSERPDGCTVEVKPPRAGKPASDPDAGTSTPRMGELVVIDQKRIVQAAAWVRAKVAATLRRGALDVGEYLLDTFFSSDPTLVRSRNPCKNASFRALAGKCGTTELPVSKTWLSNAVGIALLVRRLPQSARAFRDLPPSYQETLLPLRDPRKVERIASEVAAKNVSYRQLRELVAEERATGPYRPRTPVILAGLRRSLRAFRPRGKRHCFVKADVDELDDRQRRAARRAADRLIAKLESLRGKLARAGGESPARGARKTI